MPNRIIRDWTDSETMNKLSVHAERFFVRLIMKVDDYGRFYANVKLLKSNLFPLSDDIRDADVTRWMTECHQAGLILVYEVNQKQYLQIENFKQRLRQAVQKYPPPDDGQLTDIRPPIDGVKRSRKEVEEETEKNPKPETEPHSLIFPFSSEKFLTVWDVLRKEKKWRGKSFAALQTSLHKLSEHPEEDAIKMMQNAIAGQWQGLFDLKPHEKSNANGTKQFTATTAKPSDRKAEQRNTMAELIRENLRSGAGNEPK